MLENPFFKIFFSPYDIRRAMPDIWDGFGTNVKLMVYAEVLILIFALVLAVCAACRAGARRRCAGS